MAEHGPSEKARDAAFAIARREGRIGLSGRLRHMDDALVAAHDPALGLDRSVHLGAIVQFLEDHGPDTRYDGPQFADVVIRAFTESSSPDREGADRG